MSATACTTFPAVSLLSFSSTANATRVRRSFPCFNLYTAYLDSNSNLKLPRLRISQKRRIVRNHVFRLSKVCCLDGNHFEELSESASPSDTNDLKEATVDLKLPRRSLLVHFTCNACGERTQKLINRLAYERGTVFVQCAGCSLHHKLIDNLGLVVEYDFREEQVMDTNADEI